MFYEEWDISKFFVTPVDSIHLAVKHAEYVIVVK